MSRNISRRDFIKLAGVTSASAILAACGSKATETPNVTEAPTVPPTTAEKQEVVWMIGAGDLSDDQRAQFEEKYGITINRMDYDQAKVNAMLAAGEQLDLAGVVGTYVPFWARKNIIKDLTPYFATSKVLKVDDLLPANDMYLQDGKRYGAVKDWSPDNSIWVNKKLWNDAGITPPEPLTEVTMQQYREYAPKLMKKEGDRILVWGTDFDFNPGILLWVAATLNPTRTIYTTDFKKMHIKDDPELYNAVKFFIDWQKEGTMPSVLYPYVSGAWGGQDWVQGAAATLNYGYWFGGMAEGDNVKGEDIVFCRAPKWGPNYSSIVTGGVGAVMFEQSKVPDAAWKALEWYLGEDPAVARAKSGWGVPALKSMLPLMPVDKPWRKQAYDHVQWEIENSTVKFAQFSPYAISDVVYSAWGKYIESALRGDLTLDQFLEQFETDVNATLAEGA